MPFLVMALIISLGLQINGWMLIERLGGFVY